MTSTPDQTLSYINRTPALLSALYDLDLLPEQCPEGTRDREIMELIAVLWEGVHGEQGEVAKNPPKVVDG